MADPSGPPTTPPHARIRATSPPAMPAPKRVKKVLKSVGSSWDSVGMVQEVERELTVDIHAKWAAVMEREYMRVRELH